MFTKNISRFVFITLLTCVFMPQGASAYFTTAQTATKITDQVAIYTITYRFGIRNFDIYMPVLAERALRNESETDDRVAYTMREDGDELTTQGNTSAFVFSDAPIVVVDGMYKIDADTSKEMTLFVILTTDSDTPEMDYALQVEKLPFLVDMDEDELEVRGLNPSELTDYLTDEIELNS